MKLIDCQFEKHHIIKNHGTVESDCHENIISFRNFDYLIELIIKSITGGSYEVDLDSNIIFDIEQDNHSSDSIVSLNDILKQDNHFSDSIVSLNDILEQDNVLGQNDLNITINGNGHSIFRNKYQKMMLEIDNLVLRDVNLINDQHSFIIKVNKSLYIENSNIVGLEFNNNGNLYLKNCIFNKKESLFKNNDGRISLDTCKFEVYGQIFAEKGLIDLVKCEFENMGKIIDNENASINIKDSSFKNIKETAINNACGKLDIENVCFKNIQHSSSIISNGAYASIKKSVFEDDYGEVIYNNGVLEIEDSKFSGKNEEIIVNRDRISIKNLGMEKHYKIRTTDDIKILDDKCADSTNQNISLLQQIDSHIIKIRDSDYLSNLINSETKEIKLG